MFGSASMDDRVVVKQSVPGHDFYIDPANWANRQVGGEPMESFVANTVHLQLLLNGAGDEKFVAECLGYGDCQHLSPNLWQYKLYYEYLLGDLPGCFLWAMFESLAKTAVAMDAQGIVHGDMQSANIFFGQPDPNHFAIWPVAKLGDFGSARFVDAQGEVLRHRTGPYAQPFAAPEMAWDDSWDPGWYAVQNFDHWDPTVPPSGGYVQKPAVLSSKTNIWQIGMLMLCAIRLEVKLLETQFRHPPPGYSVPINQFMTFTPQCASRPMKLRLDDDQSRRHSRQLLTLVNKCLAVDPEARISPQNLLQEVQVKMVGRDGGMAAARGKFPWNHPQAIRMSLNDKYKIGKKPYRPTRVK
ncbi:hypothetical protein M436DRAFT_59644 [Aureobasidium namibiae CBS 147.97]|uniref:Protein kinase domain-containing protein n=1 Tax=Aureobasidium namibiae CBS 147.97 TaxID=1043004 RepID=A0A074WWT6_9PEZI|nr:uncharacterized protein M436DRAFT_59644 [Aureobasidium namibiae CBS 147.97]KEQ77675.1 hypothetical protein M436DRAFT_59644 [Aureobasidium namibiae CBS 147.97]